MPIEIKELSIKINVEEKVQNQASQKINALKLRELKTEITKACTKNVLEYIKEKQQR